MSDLKLNILLRAIDQVTGPVGKMNRKLKEAWKPVRELDRRLNKLSAEAGIPMVTARVNRLYGAMGNALGQTRRLGLQLSAMAAGAGFAFKKLFIDPAAQFETYRTMLRSLEGSNEAAQKSMDWVSDFATTVPYELTDVMDSFVKMRNFGLDPMDGSMQAIVDQTAKLGGTQETMKGIVMALGQSWQKQKLQQEEALQLIERGVPVWELLAKRLNMTTAQLMQLSTQGKLGRGAIKLLIEEMGKSSAGAAQDQAKTWSGMISMISDYWTKFANKVMSNGAFDWLKDKLQGFLGMLDNMASSGKLDELARQVGTDLVNALKQLWEFGKAAWDVMRGMADALVWLRDLFGSWKPILIGIGVVLAGPLLASLISVAAAVKALGVALMLTPVGWVIAAFAAIGAAVYLIVKHWDTIKEYAGKFWDWLVEKFKWGAKLLGKVFENSPIGLAMKGLTMLYDTLTGSSAPPTRQTGTIANTIAPGAGRGSFDGTLKVDITAEGRPRVREAQASGGIEMETSVGMSAAGLMQ